MISKYSAVFVCLFFLSACGGSSGGAAAPAPVTNAAPIVNAGLDDTVRLPADTVSLNGTVSDDGLPAGAVLSTAWSVQSGPAGATFADVNAVDTTVTFVSEGTYVLQLTADDTARQTSGTVTITVEAAPNAAPTVNAGLDVTVRRPVDTVSLDGTVSDDGLPAGAVLSTAWSVQSGPAGATFADDSAVDTTVTFVSDGTYVLQLTADDSASQTSDTVTVILEAAPALATIAVTPANVSLFTGGTQAFSASGTDQYGDAIAVNIGWSATGGAIDQAGIYTAGAIAGPFTVTATDGAVSGTADVTIMAVANVAPTANAQSVSTAEDTALAITLTGTDPETNPLTLFAVVTQPGDGTLSGTAPNLTYTPDPNFSGADSFTFTVNDGTVDSAAATISITVNPVNDVPTADAQAVSTDEDTPLPITLTGSDPETDPLTFAIGTDPTNGTLAVTAADVTYTPNADFNGPDSFTFTVNDGQFTSAEATVSITVNPVNDAPTADAQAVSTAENTALPITLTGSDSETDPLTFAIGTLPTNGTLTGTAPDVTYTPNALYVGPDSFTFTVNDGALTSAEATVSVTVTAAAPVRAFWKFEEGVGTTTVDTIAPNDGDGTIVGATWTTGATGNALDFDGNNDHVVIDNTQALNITGTGISLVAWIKPRDGGRAADGSRVISKRTDALGSDVYAMSTDEYRLSFRLDGQDMISSYIFRVNEWMHVAMVYDGVDKRIYVNGVLDIATPQAKTDLIDTSAMAVHIGKREGEAEHFNGIIDEVQILNRALSAAEVSNLFAQVIPPPPEQGTFHPFIDITQTAGLSNPADGGHGFMFADVNNDSRPDLYLTTLNTDGIARPDFLFINSISGEASFSEEGGTRGVADSDGGSHGAVWADLDNDGDYDLFNGSTWTTIAPSAGNPVNNNVYENTTGTPQFSDVTPADVLATATETRGVTAFDMDRDGDLDLFGVSGPDTPGVSEAYLNNGGFTFNTHAGGELTTAVAMEGVIDTDYDGDGDVDILAADNTGGRLAILQNDGNGIFTRIDAESLGINRSAFHGVTTADVDNDGDLDILVVTDGTGHIFIRNNGTGQYALGQTFGSIEGYMGGFADLDNDGDQDLVFAGDERVFLNNLTTTADFRSAQSVPVSEIADPRAIAFSDFDNDGDVDFAISARSSRNWLVRNDLSIDPAMPNWLKVELVSPQCQAGAFGAKTRVYPAGQIGITLLGMQESRGNGGYLAQNDPVLHFGLGSTATVDVVVTWADGTQAPMLGVAANQRILIDACP